MASKAEIGWVRRDDEGEKWQIFARQVGRDWHFFQRQRRFDVWTRVESPPLEDWMELLDAIRRLIVRRRYQPDDEQHLVNMIRDRFPEAKF